MALHEVDAGNAAVMDLLEELFEVRSAFVPYPCLREKAATCSALIDAQAQVNVLAEAHGRETAQLPVEAAANAQIEGARIELLVHLLLSATNTAGSQKRSHAVVDGFLHRRETFMCFVGTAPSIALTPLQFVIDRLQETRRQDAIAIEEDKELALTVLCAEVARRPRSTILLRVVTKLQLAGISVHDIFAG